MKSIRSIALVLALCAPLAFASGAGDKHFKGEPAETLPQAVKNFSAYNQKLEAILNGKVDDSAMADIHILTYTLENALHKMNEEMAQLAETLEKVHKASEKLDREGGVSNGRAYLKVSREIVK